MTVKFFKHFIFTITIFVTISSCAKIGSPTGGPKDYVPPTVIGSSPANYATNFHGKKIEIFFSEFIQLKDISTQFIVSPPMKKKPIVLVRNKSIVITLEEDLKPFSTYRFAFGSAVTDLNEGNALDNFNFVVSTCSVIDSLSLHGQVIDAFDHQPDKDGMYVMLFDKFHDSIPRKQLPVYVAKTSDKGWFSFNNIRADSFLIFAVKDANQNYLFDVPTEQIAFSDTLISIDERYHNQKDSIVLDTIKSDTIKHIRKIPKPQIHLYSFTEGHEKQYLDKYERITPNCFELIFKMPIADSLKLEPINFSAKAWLTADRPIFDDTVKYWITDTALVHTDTLQLRVIYSVTDSLEKIVAKIDTIKLTNKKLPNLKSNKRNDAKAPKTASLKINSTVEGKSVVDLNSQVIIEASSPVAFIDTSKILVFKTDDTDKDRKLKPVKYKLLHDSTFLRKFHIVFPFDANSDYSISIDTASITDIYSEVNDSVGFNFKTQKDDYYGKIKLSITNVKNPTIIQLLADKDVIVNQNIITKDEIVIFDFINPAKYSIKAIYDINNNKEWDTGNFGKKLQPEKVLYYNKILPVRANWELEENWKLE